MAMDIRKLSRSSCSNVFSSCSTAIVQFLFHRQIWDQTIIFEDNAGTHYRTEASSTLRQTGRRALVLLLAVGCLRLLKVSTTTKVSSEVVSEASGASTVDA